MKKYISIYKLLPAMAMAAAFSACTFEQEDFFDEPASLRIEHTNQEIKDILVSGSTEGNGWLIQYFVAGTDDQDFEGFNLYGRFFQSGKVTLSSDHRFLRNGNAGKYTEASSVYEMLKEEGSVLSFSTWNDIISVFVDPVSPSAAPNSMIGDGEGMKGDDRLVMVSYDKDQLVFRGERHSAKVYFSRLDRNPEQYAVDVREFKDHIANNLVTEYMLTNGDTTVYISGLDHGYFNIVDRLDDPLQSSTHSCVFTPQGFRMEHQYKMKNDSVQFFGIDPSFTQLTSGNVIMTPLWMRGVKRKVATANSTIITAEGASESFAALFNKLADDIKENFSAQTFNSITFGKSSESGSNSRVGIVFNVTTSKSKYLTGFTATITVDVNNQTATITADADDYSTNFQNYSKKGLGDSFTDIVKAMVGSYKLEANDPFRPSSVTWTKTDDPSFSFQAKF